MQRNEVFYLQNNLLFPQFIHSYTGFLDLVKMAPGSIAMKLAEQPDHFTKTRALGQKVMREGNNNINKQETKPGDLGPSTPQEPPSFPLCGYRSHRVNVE